MFKLIKIDNSPTNAPEMCVYPIKGEIYCYEPGELFSLLDGKLANVCVSEASSAGDLYCSLETKLEPEVEKKLHCFRVTPEMQFEADVINDALPTGSVAKIYASPNDEGGYSFVREDSGDESELLSTYDVMITDNSELNTKHKVICRLIKKQ